MEHNLAKTADVAGQHFDIVIIGRQTAGLALASRLSENADVSVAVLEAGKAHFGDELITSPMGWFRQYMNPEYDWAFLTAPRSTLMGSPPCGSGRLSTSYLHTYFVQSSIIRTSGKGLGGSSAMNFCMWTRPQREDIDAFEQLGNPGWNWERLLPYFEKIERNVFMLPSSIALPHFIAADPKPEELHSQASLGKEGTIGISFHRTTAGAESLYRESLKENGVPLSNETFQGDLTGAWKCPSIIDAKTGKRSYAVTGYLAPAINRPNLKILTEAYVTKVLLSKGTEGQVVATGVEFEHGGKIHVVNARKEVLLSAGGIKSPQILELSGIGDPAILQPLGITPIVDLPAVGTNVQEHLTHTALHFQMQEDRGIITSDLLKDPAFCKQLLESNPEIKDPIELLLTGISFVPLQTISQSRADDIVAKIEAKIAREAASYPPGLKEQYDYQLKVLKDPKVPDVEIMLTPFSFAPTTATKPIVSLLPAGVHPFSRGTIHISSADPKASPAIDPKYLSEDADLDILVEAWKFGRKAAHTAPFKDAMAAEVVPGLQVSTEEQIREHVKNTVFTVWHTCGSVSMLPKDKGGVVDSSLKVYGTKNLRVVDYSIVPLSISSHCQATVYAIAERAADIIKADHSRV
ncbi:GMC oxidoreductase [Daedaleopsis nitida]|nr:GMC oxidoreductase [Daedaleopsis nitida]